MVGFFDIDGSNIVTKLGLLFVKKGEPRILIFYGPFPTTSRKLS